MQEITCNFKAEKEDWEKFKKASRELDSDASKELRKFIKKYVKNYESRSKEK